MTSRPPHTHDDDLVLSVTRAADGKLLISPSGAGISSRRFTIQPVLSADDEKHFRSYIDDFSRRSGGHSEAESYVEQHLELVGLRYYEALFERHKHLRAWLDEALSRKSGRLIIVSDDHLVHRELWETLRDPRSGRPVVHGGVAVVRRLATSQFRAVRDSHSRALRVLLVPSRPISQSPTRAASRAGALKKTLSEDALALCMPATLPQLREQLAAARQAERPFSVAHFEGHGSHIPSEGRGALSFEDAQGELDAVAGDRLSQAFPDAALVVLESCHAADTVAPTGSWDAVAIRLVRSGVATVIATPFNAHVDQMECFMPAFYGALAAGTSISAAVGAGRMALLTTSHRRPTSNETPVQRTDWWTIQLYQQGHDLSFVPSVPPKHSGQTPAVMPPLSGGTPPGPVSALSGRPLASLGARRYLTHSGLAVVLAGMLLAGYYLVTNRSAHEQERHIRDLYERCRNGNAHHCAETEHALTSYRRDYRDAFSVESAYWLGLLKEDGRSGQSDYPGALAAYEEACQQGYALACLNHGHMAEYGRGLPTADLTMAQQDYERGCSLGNLDACTNAALLLLSSSAGELRAQHKPRARELYARACNDGNGVPRGCVGLGTLLEEQGDRAGAYKWFSLACAKDDLLGCKRQGDVSADVKARRSSYGRACAPLDQRQGACSGCIPLARSYAADENPELTREAHRLYEALCHSGCVSGEPAALSCCRNPDVRGQACLWLGWTYEFGTLGVQLDRAAAERAYRQSCASGNRRGCSLLEELTAQ